MRKIGGILLAVGLFMMLITACMDDSEIMRGMNPSFEILFIKMIAALILATIGAILMKWSEDRGR